MHTSEPLQINITTPSESNSSPPRTATQQDQNLQPQQRRPVLPSLTISDTTLETGQSLPLLSPSHIPILNEFASGEDVVPPTSKNVLLSTRVGSTGSQLNSPVNEVRKRSGRKIPKPKPLDLDRSRLGWGGNQPIQSAPSPQSRATMSAFPVLGSGSGSGSGITGIGAEGTSTKEPKHKSKFPSLQIKTDLVSPITHRRSNISNNSNGPMTAGPQTSLNFSGVGMGSIHEVQPKEPSKYQVELERKLKKIQRRKKPPPNLAWYSRHAVEIYMSGTPMDADPKAVPSDHIDLDLEEFQSTSENPPKWVLNALKEEESFYCDETVDLMIDLRNDLIGSKNKGWSALELIEEVMLSHNKTSHHGRRNRSVSPHGSPNRSPNIHPMPVSPGGISIDSATSSRHGSRSSMDFDQLNQQPAGRYVEEELGSYRLLDYFLIVISDIISHDCRYKIQHPRPSRPEWILHTVVLDVLMFLCTELIHDHKAIYDIGLISLSAFSVFKSNMLVRLLDLLTGTIIPSFAQSRSKLHSPVTTSPPLASASSPSPMSPSEIRVQLDNNQTFAIQVHSPTEEQEMLSVPRLNNQPANSPNSPNIPSSKSNMTSVSKIMSKPTTQAQETMDFHTGSLITLTLSAILQQISFSNSPLIVSKQVEKSVSEMSKSKSDLSSDILEIISIFESEKVMKRALELLWWIGKSTLGHFNLSEKLYPLDYDSIIQLQQIRKNGIQQPTSAVIGTRSNTVVSETLKSFRKATFDDDILPKSDVTYRTNHAGSNTTRAKRAYRPTLPWKTHHGIDSTPMVSLRQQDNNSTSGASFMDYLADHELYPFMFSLTDSNEQDEYSSVHCELCEMAMKGFGLYCYHCRGALHLDCFHSIKKYAGVDCAQLGSTFDLVSRGSRGQLANLQEIEKNENFTDQIHQTRAGHRLQLANLFSTCLCSACKLPIWGYHHQCYRCEGCSQLMHLKCQGSPSDCENAAQPLALRHSFSTRISYKDLRQSFVDFYQGVISIWESNQSNIAPSTLSPASKASTVQKERYSYEEFSCISSALTLQLELFKIGLSRGEIHVEEWLNGGQTVDQSYMETSDFELITLQKYFAEIVSQIQDPVQATSHSLFLSDFFEDNKPDSFLLFSSPFWSHFAAIAKTMIKETDTIDSSFSSRRFFPSPTESNFDDVFELGIDSSQEQLISNQSLKSFHTPLSTIYRFCMKRFNLQSPWTAQIILQEWVKIGLLERVDGELSLFEGASRSEFSPPVISLTPSPSLNTQPTLDVPSDGLAPLQPNIRTSYFDSHGSSGKRGNLSRLRDVYCIFPNITAIDPSPDVENLIQTIWRCLGSLNLSINECGFLLLTRQCWPDPFMSDYTKERLFGCIFRWLLLEDDHLFEIYKNYKAKGKPIPGVRHDLEERVSRKRTVSLKGGVNQGQQSPSMAGPGRTDSSVSTTPINPRVSALNTITSTGSSNSRTTSMNSSISGSASSYVLTRKLMVKKYGLPWLKKAMSYDQDQYPNHVYRQIRILERELIPVDEDNKFDQEKEHEFKKHQSERYLEYITKLRNSGFLFDSFSAVLCLWLKDVEGLMNQENSGVNHKILARLFSKPSSWTTNSNNTTIVGQSRPTTEQTTSGNDEVGDTRRTRLQVRTQRITVKDLSSPSEGSIVSVPENHSQQEDEPVETPISSLRKMMKAKEGSGIENIKNALHWLDIMVHSSTPLPVQAFLECCESLLDLGDLLASSSTFGKMKATANQYSPISAASDNSIHSPHAGPDLIELSWNFLKSCWDHISLSSLHMSEEEASDMLEAILSLNESAIQKAMDMDLESQNTKFIESVQQLLKYSLVLILYVYGCSVHSILELEIIPTVAFNTLPQQGQQERRTSTQPNYPQLQHMQRQQRHSINPIDINQESISMKTFLKCLGSPSLSLQGEAAKGLANILDQGRRLSNVEDFINSIHHDVIPHIWNLLSPLNDHMADTLIPLLMHFITQRPTYFHNVVSKEFNSQDWERRFSALDPVFGLFSKLDDSFALKLFFLTLTPTVSPFGTMLSDKGKQQFDKLQHQKVRQNHSHGHHKKRAGTSSFEPDGVDRTSTGLSGSGGSSSGVGQQENILQARFIPESLQILGPIFSHFVSSVWDSEEAVRTKAKTLLKSLQPVHVSHALKSWELHFIASPPEMQQPLLKLMTRLNNYFPNWRILSYELIFSLLTDERLGKPLDKDTNSQYSHEERENSMTSEHHETNQIPGDTVVLHKIGENGEAVEVKQDLSGRGPMRVSLPYLRTPDVNLSQSVLAIVQEEQPENTNEDGVSIMNSPITTPSVVISLAAGETSRSQKRASMLSANSPVGSVGPWSYLDEEDKAREKQLEMEDEICCSLLNLGLQMVANGIEPTLKEVIQLKFLVVFFLDFERCELLHLGNDKFQARYGEYVPRQRFRPTDGDLEGERGIGDNAMLSDAGHESFVSAICRNLQLILDRCIEIKPDHEAEATTLYEKITPLNDSNDHTQQGGIYVYNENSSQNDLHSSIPPASRTFSATTATSNDLTKVTTRVGTPILLDDDESESNSGYNEDYDLNVYRQEKQSFLCFPFKKKRVVDLDGSAYRQSSLSQKNANHRYQQQHHHHYRRKQNRRQDENAPVVGTYFVDVILRFFQSETDLSILPVARLTSWLELLLIVIYKYIHEEDQLSDLVIVLMKRIIEMLMNKKGSSNTSTAASSNAGSSVYPTNGRNSRSHNSTAINNVVMTTEELFSEENILLAISICSTLLKRSSTMTTALLSREIMAMSRLMTRRRDDPEDPIFIRAKNFLHDAFVHFMGNGLFVLVFKTQTINTPLSIEADDASTEMDSDLDLFYVLETVLGETEMVPLEPTSNPTAHTRFVRFRDQPIRDILDRATIFRDLEPVQVSAILTNLALYVERVHSQFEDPSMIADIGQFLIKITKYTTEWDHQLQQKWKDYHNYRRQDQLHLAYKHNQTLKSHSKSRPNHLLSGNRSTIVSDVSSSHILNQQRQVVTSITSGSTAIGSPDLNTGSPSPPTTMPFHLTDGVPQGPQRNNTGTSVTLAPTAASMSSSESNSVHPLQLDSSPVHQSTALSSSTLETASPTRQNTAVLPISQNSGRKAAMLMDIVPLGFDVNPTLKTRLQHNSNTFSSINSGGPKTYQASQQPKFPDTKLFQHQSWDYSNAILGMCAIIMIQNPMEGHQLIPAIRHVLKQALYRDKMSAEALIRLVTGYCYVAELDFTLSLVNIFGEFIVEELRSSLAHNNSIGNGYYYVDDLQKEEDNEDVNGTQDLLQGRLPRSSTIRDRESTVLSSATGGGGGTTKGGLGMTGNNRSRILASNLYLLHHLLLWDIDPSYNTNWTKIKWDILGSMKFPPGHPILFPGANDELRDEMAAIVSVWASKYPV